METLFIEARYKEKVLLPETEIAKLPTKICLATTVQFLDSIAEIKKQLEKAGKYVTLFSGKKTAYPGQVFGCEILTKNSDESDACLYIGDGRFHPIALALKNKKEVFIFNPFKDTIEKLDTKELEKIEKRYQAALAKFYAAEKVGVIVSTKPGQNQMKKARELKKKLDGKKECFIFVCDTLDFNELENFPFIEVWVNTICPRIAYDDSERIRKSIVNIEDII